MGEVESEGVVVVLGDPTDMERDYLNDLQDLTDSQDTAVWKVPSGAMVGDLVLVYLMAPVSAIVAHATVLQDPVQANAVPDREWGDGWWAELGYFGMVDPPIPNAVLRSSLPRWKWPAAPRSATLPKGEAALDLVEFIEQRVPTVLEDRLGDDLLSLERNHVYQVVDIGSVEPGRFAVTRIKLVSDEEAAPAEILQVLGSVEEARTAMRDHITRGLEAVAAKRTSG